MASTRFAPVADNHYAYMHDGVGSWDDAKVDLYSVPPRKWITPDEAAAVKALDGAITPGWYDNQHGLGVAGADMPADPNYGLYLAARAEAASQPQPTS